jgi:hypothetical protein
LRRPLALLALLPLAAAGCGGGGSGDPASPPGAAAPRRGHYLAGPDLERELGSGFRDGLYRLAVMSQRSDDAADLGQSLPTGLLDRVRCAPAAPQPSSGVWRWRCRVRWKAVDGKRQRTHYDVRLQPGGCFSAGATPRRPEPYDATIHAYGEDPLNGIVSASRAC